MAEREIDWWDDPDLAQVASGLARRYRGHVDLEDIKSVLVLWCLEDEPRANRLWASPWWFKTRRLHTVGERYCRKEKATAVGYELDDEVFYSAGLLRKLLPDAFDSEALPPTGAKGEIRSRSPGPGQEWETMMADLRAGLEKLPEPDLDVLWAVYGNAAGSVSAYATVKGWGYRRALRAERRALERLVAALGGQSPWVTDRDWVPYTMPSTMPSEPRTEEKAGELV